LWPVESEPDVPTGPQDCCAGNYQG
jgi:hypothetical protein